MRKPILPPLPLHRGSQATSASKIPLLGWFDVLKRTWRQIQVDNVFLISAGVAVYFLLALVPALTAFSAIGSFMLSPETIRTLLGEIITIMPESTGAVLRSQLDKILASSSQEPIQTFKMAFGFLLSFWAASAGVRAMMTAMTLAYRETEDRPLAAFYGTALCLTLAALFIGFCSLFVFVALPIAL